MSHTVPCHRPPAGWVCGRGAHDGPCAARPLIEVGQVAYLAPQGLWWLARARSADGRYVLLTTVVPRADEDDGVSVDDDIADPEVLADASRGLAVAYTLVDHQLGIRGAINVIGGGCDIASVCGPDQAIEDAFSLVTGGGFEVSHRNQVHLLVLDVRAAC